jgi:hypothetical protein
MKIHLFRVVRKYSNLKGTRVAKTKKHLLFSHPLPHGPSQIWSKLTKNHIFSFCYLVRVEHEKCSEMCYWIVRFG